MQTKHPLFNDFAKVAGGASGLVVGIKDDLENTLKGYIEQTLNSMDLVTRDEFEIVRTMATKGRMENENLKKELALLKEDCKK